MPIRTRDAPSASSLYPERSATMPRRLLALPLVAGLLPAAVRAAPPAGPRADTHPLLAVAARWRIAQEHLAPAVEARARHPSPGAPEAERRAAEKHAAGTARIHLQTGQVRLGPPEKAPPPAGERLPPLLDKLAVRW